MRGIAKNTTILPEASLSTYPVGSLKAKVAKPAVALVLTPPELYKPWDSIPEVAMKQAILCGAKLHEEYKSYKRLTAYNVVTFKGDWGKEGTHYTCYGGMRNSICPTTTPKFNQDTNPIAYFCTEFITDVAAEYGVSIHFPEQEDKFLDWLFSESMFSEVFVTKTAKEAREKGVICHTHLPASIVIQACTFGRSVSNMPRICKMWDILVNEGIEPHLAMLLGHQFMPREQNDFDEISPAMTDGGNSVFNALSWFTNKGFTRFVNQSREKWHDDPMYKVPGMYKYYLTQWQDVNIASGNDHFNVMQDSGHIYGTVILLSDAIAQAHKLQKKYIG